jgi:drug/metabolite transporter (DMT)-like permease
MISKTRLKAYLYLGSVAIIWGAAGPIIKQTLQGINTLPFLLYRFAISSIVAIITFKFIRQKKLNFKEWIIVLIYSIFASSLSLYFLFVGLEKTTVLDTILITTINPLLVSMAGFLIFKDKITSKEKLGIFIALVGTTIAIIQPLIESESKIRLQGNIFVALYLLTNTTAAILAKKLTRLDISPLFITSCSFITGFLTILPIAFLKNVDFVSNITQLELKYHIGVWFMALISGNLAYTLWVKGQKSIEISEAALFTYLQPIFSTPLAIIWLKEKTSTTFFVGALFIIIGVIIAETKKLKKTKEIKRS